MSTLTHALSLRVPSDMFQESSRIAQQWEISFNALVQEALQRVIDEERKREMYEAATLLGMDSELTDVDYARHAQAEVMLNAAQD